MKHLFDERRRAICMVLDSPGIDPKGEPRELHVDAHVTASAHWSKKRRVLVVEMNLGARFAPDADRGTHVGCADWIDEQDWWPRSRRLVVDLMPERVGTHAAALRHAFSLVDAYIEDCRTVFDKQDFVVDLGWPT